MARGVPPPDFRYVGLEPGPSSREVAVAAGGVGGGAFALALGLGGTEVKTLAAAGAVALLTGLLAARGRGPCAARDDTSQVTMAIVPWGVMIQAEQGQRILHWAAVRSVQVDLVHQMDHATPSICWSLVTITTDRERFGGRARGAVSLERLEAHLESYQHEAARPLALDLDGEQPVEAPLEPVFDLLLAEARRLLGSGELAQRLGVPPASYRRARGSPPSSDTMLALRRALLPGGEAPADARPLACIVAAELGASELGGVIAPLTLSPNPAVAAIARAASLRLGGPLKRVGSLDEIAEFVPCADLELLERWVREPLRRAA
jgi:hypothetical protein